ncbi:McrC family protein [Enterococcus durans]|uniref:McrC family protein n=1 Tax=Enterococcus durans TaxID=53345 RepID=UPI0022394216|nr:McrC family protein [Enterococcus durans]
MSWLWEEYIGKVTGWKHYGRDKGLATMHLFQELNRSPRYPDFTFNNIPIDTKYKKHLDTRNDYNQLVTYIHIMNLDQADTMKGGFLQPTSDPLPAIMGIKNRRIKRARRRNIHISFFHPASFIKLFGICRTDERGRSSTTNYFSISRSHRNFTQKIFIKQFG